MLRRGVVQGSKRPAHISFPDRLKKARLAAGVPPTRLSLDAGLANNAVANLETAARVPGIDTIELLARALSLSPCWLAFGIEQPCAASDATLCASIGERLQVARLAAGHSARALAALAEISPPTVLRTEKGLFFPRLDTVERLGKALNVSPCWLAYGVGPQAAPSRRRLRISPPAAEP